MYRKNEKGRDLAYRAGRLWPFRTGRPGRGHCRRPAGLPCSPCLELPGASSAGYREAVCTVSIMTPLESCRERVPATLCNPVIVRKICVRLFVRLQ